MDFHRTLQISLATAGILNFLMVAIFLFYTQIGNIRANRILGILLLSVCFKLSFAILINIKHKWGFTSHLLHGLSVAGYLSFGPLLYLYFKAFCKNEIIKYHHLWIFIPLIFPFFALKYDYRFMLWFAQFYFALFLLITFFWLKNVQKNHSIIRIYNTEKKWIFILFSSFLLLWLIVNILILDFDYYFVELLLFFILIFYIDIYLVIKHYWLKKGDFKEEPNIKKLALKTEEEYEILNRLNHLMDKEKIYIDPELTLPKVASLLKIKVYKLSYVINKTQNMTFNEYINSYRIRDIIKILATPECHTSKIASLAFDHGFNSLSVFNHAFKKITNYSPSEFKNNNDLRILSEYTKNKPIN